MAACLAARALMTTCASWTMACRTGAHQNPVLLALLGVRVPESCTPADVVWRQTDGWAFRCVVT